MDPSAASHGTDEGDTARLQPADVFEWAFSHSPVPKSITRLGGPAKINDAFCEMLGYTREELGDETTWIGLTHPDDVEETRRQMDALISGEQSVAHYEKRYLRKDGSIVWADLHSALRRDEDGRPLYFATTITDITERKYAVEALRDSERWLAESQRVAALGHYNYDIALDRWEASPALREVFGMVDSTGGDFSQWLDIAHPEERERLTAYFTQEVIGLRRPFDIDYRIVRPRDGAERWVHGLGTVEFAGDGAPLRMFGVIQDVTERRVREAQVQAGRDEMEGIIGAIQDGFSVLDSEGRHVMVNRALCEMTGFSADELIGVGAPHPYWPPEELQMIGRALSTAEAGQQTDFELTFMRKNDERFPVIVSPSVVRNENGEAVRCIATVKDITERKKAEQGLLYISQAVESASDAIGISDSSGHHIFQNRALTELFGYATAEEMDAAGGGPAAVHDPKVAAEMFEAIQSGRPWVGELEMVTKDGRVFPAYERAGAVTDERGRIIGLIGIITDITERRAVEDDARRSKLAVEEANRQLADALAREQRLARIDALTGVSNRRHWFELAEHEFDVAARYAQPLSVMLFDFDNFKQVNDTFGHAVGDVLLQRMAAVSRVELRSADVLGRYGGDEFVVVFPITTAKQAYPLAERILAEVAAIRVETDDGPAWATLSIGIAEMLPHGTPDSLEHMVDRADDAMYGAKAGGRNRIHVHSGHERRAERDRAAGEA